MHHSLCVYVEKVSNVVFKIIKHRITILSCEFAANAIISVTGLSIYIYLIGHLTLVLLME